MVFLWVDESVVYLDAGSVAELVDEKDGALAASKVDLWVKKRAEPTVFLSVVSKGIRLEISEVDVTDLRLVVHLVVEKVGMSALKLDPLTAAALAARKEH